jgi:hypothetical protein
VITDAKIAPGVTDDDNRDISGRPAPLLGGEIIVEASGPSAIYLPVLDDNGIVGQLLAEPSLL